VTNCAACLRRLSLPFLCVPARLLFLFFANPVSSPTGSEAGELRAAAQSHQPRLPDADQPQAAHLKYEGQRVVSLHKAQRQAHQKVAFRPGLGGQ
jgi:hypothetical protein